MLNANGNTGAPCAPIKHNFKRRCNGHNYNKKGTYFITIETKGRLPLFGEILHEPKPWIKYTPLGYQVAQKEAFEITKNYSMVEVWAMCVMPDHLHMIIRIKTDLPAKKHLGHVIGGFKGGCSRAYWNFMGQKTVGIFEEGYTDGILMNEGQLENWKNYILDNPRRLSLKLRNPDLFKLFRNVSLVGYNCQLTGNIFLLDYPEKKAVIMHRRYTETERNQKIKEWLECGERGGVLVSASIAEEEKRVMGIAFDRGYRIILLRENGFQKYFKPGGRGFEACVIGQLLQICPWEYHFDRHKITRAQCLSLNAIAEALCEMALNPLPSQLILSPGANAPGTVARPNP